MPKQLTIEQRARIILLLEEGYSTRSIAERESVSQTAVVKTGKRKRETGNLKDRPREGRPVKFTKREERRTVRKITRNECSTAVDIQKELKKEGKDVSTETVRRVLKKKGLKSKVKCKKPFLSKKHKQQRLKFALNHREWTIEMWRQVIWSDESKFMIFGSDGREYCWKRPSEPLKDCHIKPTVKFGGGSIMVWGCFTSQGVGNLCWIQGKMNSELYCQILEEDLMGTLDWYGLRKEDVTFQQDNDPKHTSNKTKDWLFRNNINVLEWPAQSPDLNPIENLWGIIKRKLRGVRVKSKNELWEIIEEVWNDIDEQICNKLIDTLPQRICDVIKVKGSYTRW